MNEEKIKEVFSDEKFVKSLMELETPEEVQKALAEKDIDLSIDEIKKVAELLQKKAEGELSDANLENVAGGSITGLVVFMGICTGAGAGYLVNKVTRRRW